MIDLERVLGRAGSRFLRPSSGAAPLPSEGQAETCAVSRGRRRPKIRVTLTDDRERHYNLSIAFLRIKLGVRLKFSSKVFRYADSMHIYP
jgi:hypothetical protein